MCNCRAMLCISATCRSAVSVRLSFCPSIRPTRSCIVLKRVITSSKIFHRRIATPFCFFYYQTLWQYTDRDPLTRASNEGTLWKKSLFFTSILLHRVLSTVRPSDIVKRMLPLVTLIGGVCVQQSSEARYRITTAICCRAMLCDRQKYSYDGMGT